MKYEIYCDESHPDVFWSHSDQRARFLLIGGVWIPAELRQDVKNKINQIKINFDFKQEIKWRKVHVATEGFYRSLIDLFIRYGDQMRFRCIAVEGEKVDMVCFHQCDRELGFYKFYYQMITHWILDFNEYRIFCDLKTNRVGNRLKTLKDVLNNANISSKIVSVQALPSNEVVIIQLTDLLLGMASARINGPNVSGSMKERLISYLEQRLNIKKLGPTSKAEQKFNIFQIKLEGGW